MKCDDGIMREKQIVKERMKEVHDIWTCVKQYYDANMSMTMSSHGGTPSIARSQNTSECLFWMYLKEVEELRWTQGRRLQRVLGRDGSNETRLVWFLVMKVC